jgi:CheY-like chemotaxis protein
VAVTVLRQQRRALVGIRDTGCGMAPAELSQVFEPFAQAPVAAERMAGGLGLGLTIARSLVKAHDGALEAHSEGRGKGTELSFSLPLRRAPRQGAAPARRLPDPRSLRVLVVDDHRDAARGLAELLTLMGHEPRVAHDGPSALAAAAEDPPELVISDLGMPGMDGYELAARLREDPRHADTCLCALSGYGDETAVRRARESGFDRHLTKPVDLGELERLLDAARDRELPRRRTTAS